jgi:DNA-binding NarL/FixJ family response regulator
MIRVAIIEDSRQIREALQQLIGGSEGYSVTETFRTMEQALDSLSDNLPDVALVDIGLPGMSGIEGIRYLAPRHPGVQFVVLSVYSDDQRIFHALCAGARGYILKKTPPARMLEYIREVAGGGSAMSPEIARRVIELFHRYHPSESIDYALTPHEARILQLLVQGHNRKSAAIELGVTVHAISFHLREIYHKLQVHSRSEAVAKALRAGLIS